MREIISKKVLNRSKYRHNMNDKYLNTIPNLMNKSVMVCSMADIINGKIPDEHLRNRFLFYHFVFIHQPTKQCLYPSKVDYYKKGNDGNTVTFELASIDDKKAILNHAENFDHKTLNPKTMKTILFNNAHQQGNIIQPHFTSFVKPILFDDFDKILVYFLNTKDYENHRKFLDKTVQMN